MSVEEMGGTLTPLRRAIRDSYQCTWSLLPSALRDATTGFI